MLNKKIKFTLKLVNLIFLVLSAFMHFALSKTTSQDLTIKPVKFIYESDSKLSEELDYISKTEESFAFIPDSVTAALLNLNQIINEENYREVCNLLEQKRIALQKLR